MLRKWWLSDFPDPAAQLTEFRLMPNGLPPTQQPNDQQYRRRELTENPGGEDDDLVAHGAGFHHTTATSMTSFNTAKSMFRHICWMDLSQPMRA